MSGDLPAEDIVRRLVLTAQHSPRPVYGADLCGDLIAWNDAATTYYTDFGRLAPDRRNMLRWLLESPEAREHLHRCLVLGHRRTGVRVSSGCEDRGRTVAMSRPYGP